ncbi:MAG TPA: hypothetical protein VG078_00840 [Acidimicrobiales bacterium]|nr:hypothetical protein [Acidimicrobiales bacterium]
MTLAIVSGALANKAGNGGAAWTRLSWALGLRRLGFDVHFVEQLAPRCPPGAAAYFGSVMDEFGLGLCCTLLSPNGAPLRGLSTAELGELAAETALLVNISGHLTLPQVKDRVGARVYVDLDPGFTQIWQSSGTSDSGVGGHDFWFTVGENVGNAGCLVPTNGVPWRPIRQPVVLDLWPAGRPVHPHRFTTVASWRGPYGPLEHGGRTYGVKAHELRRLLPLPLRVPAEFELALDIHPADAKDRAALEEHGWRLVDPGAAAGTPAEFRRYVQRSGAEFSVAQGVYVHTGSGWFSDRTVRYLASGRPALVQDTGFTRTYPVGDGLLAFSTLDEAVAGARAIADDYQHHCAAARALAEEWFASDRVLARMCEEVGVAP